VHCLESHANRLGLHILVHSDTGYHVNSRCSISPTLLRLEKRPEDDAVEKLQVDPDPKKWAALTAPCETA
jgi:hypothetical protein